MGRLAMARRLRLVSNSLVARHFDQLPSVAAAQELLRVANARAPAGVPALPGERALWLYGAGESGKRARKQLDAVGQAIAGVIDANAASYASDPDWAGIPVCIPDGVPETVRAAALIAVATGDSPYVPLESELIAAGWVNCVPFDDVAEAFRDRNPDSDGWFAAALTAEELALADEVLAGFADADSSAHYLRFAAWRLARQEWDFAAAPVTLQDRFFIPEIAAVLRKDERFLDAGAHHGTVTARLLAETADTVSMIWAVEPDAANRAVLQAYVDGLGLDLRARIRVLDAVIGARAEAAHFHDGLGEASQVAVTGQRMRASIPLDGLAIDPTFMKLHLEGGELAALQGARETLRRRRPMIALTVYHDAAGLIETPHWLMRNLPDYAVLMRTHSWCGTGAVLYAIPKERTAQ
ncbi:hypothetical protein GCM10007301_05860 [Azorhizobium oxalatiphilum]|uniref:FkbM family methyltransferase n=1 Tax=Azorhizobium oxalatiphilum TaxID=980631 RepID=A0A917BN39_9HYPH|nr:FkbM family methyltransferase [Azorhizobium oxalatiphilum]GGF49451.1 hypothetical protein GCM10007301_05860 [Azorhizobium oxalatiphilum]